MNTLIKVSTSSITNDATKIGELINTIPNLLNELEGAMNELSTCWEGTAWQTYQDNLMYYIEMLTEIYTYMKNYVTNLEASSEIYGRAEQNVTATLKLLNMFS